MVEVVEMIKEISVVQPVEQSKQQRQLTANIAKSTELIVEFVQIVKPANMNIEQNAKLDYMVQQHNLAQWFN